MRREIIKFIRNEKLRSAVSWFFFVFAWFLLPFVDRFIEEEASKNRYRERAERNAFIFQGQNLCMTPSRWMPRRDRIRAHRRALSI